MNMASRDLHDFVGSDFPLVTSLGWIDGNSAIRQSTINDLFGQYLCSKGVIKNNHGFKK
jgi:hypothetical protein